MLCDSCFQTTVDKVKLYGGNFPSHCMAVYPGTLNIFIYQVVQIEINVCLGCFWFWMTVGKLSW